MASLKGFIGETVVYGFGNAFARILAMLLIPLYAEHLGKIDYSNLVMLQSSFSVLSFVLALNSGVFYYFYEKEDKDYRRGVFASWFFYQIGLAVILFILLLVFANPLSTLFLSDQGSGSDIRAAIPLLGIQFIPYIFNITNINLYRIERKPTNVIGIVLLEAALTLSIVYGGLNYLDWGLFEVVAAQLCSKSLVSLAYWKSAVFYAALSRFSWSMTKDLVAFSWPFFIISGFSWAIISIDKFIGAQVLTNKEDVALLALGMQLTIPIVILADMIRMAIGPFIMSIRKNSDADKTYQEVFDLSVASGAAVMLGLVGGTPILTLILADSTYSGVLILIPLLALGNIISLANNQIGVSFSLVKKNTYLLYGSITGSILGIVINYMLMPKYGFIISGISQVLSYLVMGVILYLLSKKHTENKISLNQGFKLLLPPILYTTAIYLWYDRVTTLSPVVMLFSSVPFLILLAVIYVSGNKQLTWTAIFNKVLRR